MLHSVPSYTPLFQVLFVLQNASVPTLSFSGLKVEHFRIDDGGTSQFDLILYFKETAQGLTAWLRYKTDLIEVATITRMRTHFQTLLESIVAEPEQRISELPCLTEAERQQLPVFGNHNQFFHESDTASLEKAYQAPKDALELQLTKIWEKVLRVHPIGVTDNFFDLGGNSLLAIRLFAQIVCLLKLRKQVAKIYLWQHSSKLRRLNNSLTCCAIRVLLRRGVHYKSFNLKVPASLSKSCA
jgi:non-ribosomal peptide synthetase component F